jgi:hypothetical protein
MVLIILHVGFVFMISVVLVKLIDLPHYDSSKIYRGDFCVRMGMEHLFGICGF